MSDKYFFVTNVNGYEAVEGILHMDTQKLICVCNKENSVLILDSLNRKSDEAADDIIRSLAEWSIKYPKGLIYPMSKITMDDELEQLEKRAKEYCKQFINH